MKTAAILIALLTASGCSHSVRQAAPPPPSAQEASAAAALALEARLQAERKERRAERGRADGSACADYEALGLKAAAGDVSGCRRILTEDGSARCAAGDRSCVELVRTSARQLCELLPRVTAQCGWH